MSASGQTLCHRFYYFHSFKKCHPYFGRKLSICNHTSCNGLFAHWIQDWGRITSHVKDNQSLLLHLSKTEGSSNYRARRYRSCIFVIFKLLVGLYSVANSPSSNRDVCALYVWLPFVWNHGSPPSLYSLFYKSKHLSIHEQLLTFRNSTAMRLLHSVLGTFSMTVYKSPSACNILQTRLPALLFIYLPCITLYLFIYLSL